MPSDVVPDIGTGATLTTSGTSWVARINSIDWDGITREHVETSHLGSSEARTFMPGDLYDPGTLNMEVQHDPSVLPPGLTSATQQEWSLEFPLNDAAGHTTKASMTALASMQDYSISVALEELITASVAMKCSGPITFTSATS